MYNMIAPVLIGPPSMVFIHSMLEWLRVELELHNSIKLNEVASCSYQG